jgi:hypothetical protein
MNVTRRGRACEGGDGTTKAHHLLNEAQQEAEHELEADVNRAWRVHVYGGVEGGFISFDQHTLMLSTIVRFVDVCEKFIFNHTFITRYCVLLWLY